MFLCLMIRWVETPLPLLLYVKVGKVYKEYLSQL
jgi:hypothetical protein